MGNVAQNVRNVKELIQQVRLHPQLYRLLHDDGTYITFFTVRNTRQPRQVSYGFRKGQGRTWAYQQILDWLNMEQEA